MRIVFMGTPACAVPVLEALHRSGRHRVAAVVTQPDRERGRGRGIQSPPVRQAALALGLPVVQPPAARDEEFSRVMGDLMPDAVAVAAFGQFIPGRLLDLPRHGYLNIHPSLLPRWRGAAPVARAIEAGDRVTGVSVMRLVAKMDAGDVFVRAEEPIGPDDDTPGLTARLFAIGSRLLMETLDRLEQGTAEARPQDESKVTFAPAIAKDEGAIDWALSARALHDRVRAFVPWPLAHTFHRGRRLLIHRSRVVDWPAPAPPGSVVRADRAAFYVQTGEGALSILEAQFEGRQRQPFGDLLNGARIETGALLGPAPTI